MPRKPRQEVDAGLYHVFARGNDRQPIFRDAVDCETYLGLLAEVVMRFGWRCMAYCLMPNHMHLLVETIAPSLGTGMHRLQGRYAQIFNARHDRTGHLFANRYKAVPVVDDVQFVTTLGYIAMNPVGAGLSASPEAWPWSSHGPVAGHRTAPAWLAVARLFEYIDAWGGEPRQRYREIVDGRLRAGYLGGSEAA